MSDFEPEEIFAQIDKIVESPGFRGGKRLSQFLRYVSDQKVNSNVDSLKQYTIATEALGCSDDFDPQSNPIVRILAKRLRRELDTYYYSKGDKDPIKVDIPKGTYVPVFSVNENGDSGPSSDNVSKGMESKANELPDNDSSPSIAVVLFSCLNEKDELDYLASGLTEEIIISLTRFPGFKVAGPLLKEILQDKAFDSQGIGKTYNVRFLLDGSIRKRGASLRITAKLTDTQSGIHIWGDVLDCDLQNGSLVKCEESIVSYVAAAIGDNFGIINKTLSEESLKQKTGSPSSYEATLRFYHWIMKLTDQSYIDALGSLEEAVKNDPDNALCLAALGDILASSYIAGYEDSLSIIDRAEELGRKAVALDPLCQQARFTMAMVYFCRFQRSQFLEEVAHVLKINPNNANLSGALGMHLWMIGERNQGRKLIDKAMVLNPHHPSWYYIVPFCHNYRVGDYGLALSDAQKLNTPEFYIDPLFRAAVYGHLNLKREGKLAVKELLNLYPNFQSHGRDLAKRLVYLDEHVDMLWDGLLKAGICE